MDGMNYVVFADFGYNGSSIDMFIDAESAHVFADELKAENDYECIYVGRIGDDAKIYGEPSGLAQFYTNK